MQYSAIQKYSAYQCIVNVDNFTIQIKLKK